MDSLIVVAAALGIAALAQINWLLFRWGRKNQVQADKHEEQAKLIATQFEDIQATHRVNVALMGTWTDKMAAAEKQAIRQAQDDVTREKEHLAWREQVQDWSDLVNRLDLEFRNYNHQRANDADDDDEVLGALPLTHLPGPDDEEDPSNFLPSVSGGGSNGKSWRRR